MVELKRREDDRDASLGTRIARPSGRDGYGAFEYRNPTRPLRAVKDKVIDMRTVLSLIGVALLGGVLCFGYEDKPATSPDAARETGTSPRASTKTQTKPTKVADGPAKQKPAAKENESVAEVPHAEGAKTPGRTADEEAIRQSDQAFIRAYEKGDAAGVAALFAVDAEFVDESGEVFQGRDSIEKAMQEFFEENPGCKLEIHVESLRFLSPLVAVEDGRTLVTRAEGAGPVDSRYTTVHMKLDGKWLAASVRDHAPKDRKQHRAQLQQLDWLKGEWVDEGDDSLIVFSCQAVDNGNFLLRKFTIEVAGQEVMSGTQRIGWDPLSGKLRAWIFDSEGGYAEGCWHRDDDRWVLKTTGVTADGEPASSTSIYTFVSQDVMTWQSIHHEVAGVQIPDSEVITIVRQAPSLSADVASDRE